MTSPEKISPSGIVLRSAARRFGAHWVLAGIDLDFEVGKTTLIVGANGSGKTTLLRCISTGLRLNYGNIYFNGVDAWANRHELRSDLALFTHANRLYDDLTAAENLRVWARLGGLEVDTEQALANVGLPTNRHTPVKTFSAGMRRRLALARTLMFEPSFLLLDEPFAAFDPEGRASVADLIKNLQESGTTIIIASHMVNTAAKIAHHVVSLDSGRVAWQGTPESACERFG